MMYDKNQNKFGRRAMPNNSRRGGGSNIYKSGKLSRDGSFAKMKKVNRTPIIVLACVLITLIFAIILGNILGKKADDASGTTTAPSAAGSDLTPEVNKTPPSVILNAYAVDMSTASAENSLSDQTSEARASGNALFFDLRYPNGDLLYSSDTVDELGLDHRENLTLTRLNNHFQYYNDFAFGRLRSDLGAELDAKERIEVKAQELAVLLEATEHGFDQIAVSFGENMTRADLAMYQSYLMDLKLACPTTPVGVELTYSFITDADNAGMVVGLLSVADFYLLELGDASAEELESLLAPLIYFTERYGGVIAINDLGDETLQSRIEVLEKKGIENYIIK